MYSVGKKDRVRLLKMPPSSIGAPCPMLFAREHRLFLAYYVHNTPEDWDGTWAKVVDPHTSNMPVALVTFKHPYAHFFGPPHEDAFEGHPLGARGFRPHNSFEVFHSSWIRSFEQMNLADSQCDPDRLADYRHFIFGFHDTTFECVARGLSVHVRKGCVASILRGVYKEL